MSDAPRTNTDLSIRVPATLKTAIEMAAAAEGKSVDDWAAAKLEAAVPAELLATVRQEDDAYNKAEDARSEERYGKLMDKHHGRDTSNRT